MEHNGKELKKGVTVVKETRVINGETVEVEVLNIPPGCKNPYVEDENTTIEKKKTTKPNPDKDAILEELLKTFVTFSGNGKMYKTKASKYVIQLDNGKYFSLMLTANNKTPADMTLYELEDSGE